MRGSPDVVDLGASIQLFGLPLAAAAFDYIENVLELYALKGIDTMADVQTAITYHTFSDRAILWQSLSARIKYALLAISLAAIVVTLIARVASLVRYRSRAEPPRTGTR